MRFPSDKDIELFVIACNLHPNNQPGLFSYFLEIKKKERMHDPCE
jgi:hypothetical protein